MLRDGDSDRPQPDREPFRAAAAVRHIPERMHGLVAALGTLSAEEEALRAAGEVALSAPPEIGIATPVGEVPARADRQAADESSRFGSLPSLDVSALLHRASHLAESTDNAWRIYAERSARVTATPSLLPSAGQVSSSFNPARFHPILRVMRPHRGIDIAAPTGTPILAPSRGTVRFAGTRSDSYGQMVEIDHGYGYVTRFAHASRIRVRTGERVERGQVIAEVGSTGLSTGPHLHYEVLLDGRQVDPMQFVRTAPAPTAE